MKINSPYSSKQLSVDDQELLSSFVYIYEFLNLMFPKVLKNVLFVLVALISIDEECQTVLNILGHYISQTHFALSFCSSFVFIV